MKKLLKCLLNHNVLFGHLIGWFYTHLSVLSPFRLVADDPFLVAFFHPIPSFADHILVLPKKVVRRFCDLTDFDFLDGILASAGGLCRRMFPGEEKILLVNGGSRQEIQQLHFHLIGREEVWSGNSELTWLAYGERELADMRARLETCRGFTLVFDLTQGNRMGIYFVK